MWEKIKQIIRNDIVDGISISDGNQPVILDCDCICFPTCTAYLYAYLYINTKMSDKLKDTCRGA